MITFEDVTKFYPGQQRAALRNINLEIDKGEFVFLVGQSGSGKSTFLRLILREYRPTKGTLYVAGKNLGTLPQWKVPGLRRQIGTVFQDYKLLPYRTAYENVAFAMRVVGAREKDIRKRVPYVINIVGLSQKARCYPNELSGGEQQRVALARALVNNADIIIADEPTGNVDPQMSLEIVGLLKRLNETGTTVIMVTHAHDLVRRFDNRVIVLDGGAVVSDGSVGGSGIPVQPSSHRSSVGFSTARVRVLRCLSSARC